MLCCGVRGEEDIVLLLLRVLPSVSTHTPYPSPTDLNKTLYSNRVLQSAILLNSAVFEKA